MKKLYFVLLLMIGFFCDAQVINFPDPVFKAKLLAASPSNAIASNELGPAKIDINDNGEIEQVEAAQIRFLNISASGISNLTGINYFTGLYGLYCGNNQLSTLDVSTMPLLNELLCDNNMLTSLNLGNIPIFRLSCTNNQLQSLDLSGTSGLGMFYAQNNLLTTIDLSALGYLEEIFLEFNQLSEVTFPSGSFNAREIRLNDNLFTNLNFNINVQSGFIFKLNFQNNQITTVDVTFNGQSNTGDFDLRNNPITHLDLHIAPTFALEVYVDEIIPDLQITGRASGLTIDNSTAATADFSHVNASAIYMTQAQDLTYAILKNGNADILFLGEFAPLLSFICTDDSDLPGIENYLTANNAYPDLVLNNYCSFTPGGTFYTITGIAMYDLLNNGCDISDIIAYPNLKYSISNGSASGSIISNSLGIYQIPVQEGTHTIQPNVENPSYFNITPASIAINFPAVTSPYNQDFCITPNGVHPDLEVSIIPLNGARPGFDSDYKLLYKNKGNVTSSGNVSFSYGNNVEFVSATPNISSQGTQVLNWDFSGLQPFEQREIIVAMNVNSPTETPAVNDGDNLHFSVSGGTDLTDEMPEDNSAVLNQQVFNSFDPNDKKCLEGNTIAPTMVGKYVHYQIRFENTGSANAQNIVVKDMIDNDKFDISSLIPMDSSHDFYTRINGNKVEFIFENIQLPFEDANNDGYVMFKIKTKSTLVVGNTFSNSASIYFDYNAPIVTDPAVTTISVLATKDFKFANYFTIYPNPTSNDLNIQKKGDLEISSISIYNVLGQVLITIPTAQDMTKVDVSTLTTGNYFIKINSDKGTSNTRFVKN
jgi:uncharacterized repeat protein (TIGR01451 family)